MPKRFIGNKIVLGKIRDNVNEFKRDSASHVFSTFRITGEATAIDATMNDTTVAKILSGVGNSYFFKIKFIVQLDTGEWIVRDKFALILKNGKAITVNSNSKPGLLTGIDKPFYEQDYPVTVVMYGLYPLNKKPNVGKLAPMKNSSTLNCVAERVLEHFANASRGNK